MARKVTEQDIKRMIELYANVHTYAEVARQTGFSASTVRKYILEAQKKNISYEEIDKSEWKIVRIKNLDFNKNLPIIYNIGEVCVLSEEERKEIQELWKEIYL